MYILLESFEFLHIHSDLALILPDFVKISLDDIYIYIYNGMYDFQAWNSYIFYLLEEKKMRFIIDTELERIIVPESFFNQIDKMNKVLIENNAADKKIDYVKYINDAIAKAQQNAPIRKSDIKSIKK